MTRFTYLASAIALTVTLNACAGTRIASPVAAVAGEPTADVYVVRPSAFATAVRVGVYQDDKLVGDLGPRNYLHWRVPATGQPTELTAKTENRSELTFTPRADSTYYFRAGIRAYGFLIARTKLQPMDPVEGAALVAKFRNRGKNTGDGTARGALDPGR